MRQDRREYPLLCIGASLIVLLLVIVGGCAHIVPPSGGPYDMEPPVLVRSTPERNALKVSAKDVTLYFDEYVKLEDIVNKVIISPPQLAQPKIRAVGKRVRVELEDDLVENTTYTIDFTDAIVDNNEGNPLENFSFAFSTGDEIDTMEISGLVLDARTLEPVQGVVVGIHPEEAGWKAFEDTTFARMSRTSDRAKFILRNVKQGSYSLYALRETDGNYRHDMATEGIAFLDSLVTTSSFPDIRMDTLWVDSLTIDTITEVPYTHYLPDNVVLRYFEAATERRFISKRERPEKLQLKLTFNAPLLAPLEIKPIDSLYIINKKDDDEPRCVVDSDPSGLMHIFFPDTTWGDYSHFELRYLSVDSINQRTTVIDTLQLAYRPPRPERNKEAKKPEPKKTLTTPSLLKCQAHLPSVWSIRGLVG